MAHLELKRLSKNFGTTAVLAPTDLVIEDGEFVVLVGPSGCGKTTLLRCLAGLETISGGSLLIDGRDVSRADPVSRGVAMVFQSYALYPHMTVAENIGFGLRIAGVPAAERMQRVREVAQLLQLTPLLERKPRALSGGQRQRVAIGRALARKPPIFLFDEPLSNLDAGLRAEMRIELARLHRELGNTMIYVTHDQVEAMTLADRIVILNAGRIEQTGSPLDLYNRPASRFVASFLGQPPMNFFTLAHGTNDAPSPLPLPAGVNQERSSATLVGIRPEHLRIAPDSSKGAVMATADVVEQFGGETVVYAALADGQRLAMRITGQRHILSGDRIPLSFDPVDLHLFDASGKTLSSGLA